MLVTYEDVRAKIDALVRDAYQEDNGKFAATLAALGIPSESMGVYETVAITSTITQLVGSAFQPAQDRKSPEQGPDPILSDRTVMALIVKAIVEAVDEKYEADVKNRLNPLIEDYNTRFGTNFQTL